MMSGLGNLFLFPLTDCLVTMPVTSGERGIQSNV